MNEPEGAAKFLRQVWFVIGFEKEIVALWESGRPGVGFPLFHGPSRLWECGNRAAISKDGGKSGKPAFGFPGFPRAVTDLPRFFLPSVIWKSGFYTTAS